MLSCRHGAGATHRSRGRWLPAARLRRLPEPGEYKERAGRGKQLVLLSDQRQPRQHGSGRGQGEVCLANTEWQLHIQAEGRH